MSSLRDYVDENVRNRLDDLDGNITHEIIIGRKNAALDKKIRFLKRCDSELDMRRTVFFHHSIKNSEVTERCLVSGEHWVRFGYCRLMCFSASSHFFQTEIQRESLSFWTSTGPSDLFLMNCKSSIFQSNQP